jgi:hypothetical protein
MLHLIDSPIDENLKYTLFPPLLYNVCVLYILALVILGYRQIRLSEMCTLFLSFYFPETI